MVGNAGLEPATPRSQSACATNCANFRKMKAAVSVKQTALILIIFLVVGVPGVEPGTSRLSVVRSNQLSYTPVW